jgi:hypothetical protein
MPYSPDRLQALAVTPYFVVSAQTRRSMLCLRCPRTLAPLHDGMQHTLHTTHVLAFVRLFLLCSDSYACAVHVGVQITYLTAFGPSVMIGSTDGELVVGVLSLSACDCYDGTSLRIGATYICLRRSTLQHNRCTSGSTATVSRSCLCFRGG